MGVDLLLATRKKKRLIARPCVYARVADSQLVFEKNVGSNEISDARLNVPDKRLLIRGKKLKRPI